MIQSVPRSVLLVDGYNIIGAWSYLKRIRDSDGLEAARGQLIEALINYSAFTGYETQIVFDAQYQNNCSHQETIAEKLLVYYTDFGQTADTYIEKVCASFRSYLHQMPATRLIVATSDRTQQLMVLGYGAEWMSAQQLGCEVEIAARQGRQRHKPRKQSKSRFLANALDAKARQRLAELRLGLK